MPKFPIVDRRRFLSTCGAAVTGCTVACQRTMGATASTAVPLGLDAHSLRAMKWKATELIKFAAQQKLDAVLLNNLNYFESHQQQYLIGLKQLAAESGIQIYIGAGGICKNAVRFSDRWGKAEDLVTTAISVAKTLGSPVVNVRIGSIEDRFLDGGIQPRIDEAIRVLKATRSQALEAGIKFGFENHAADLRSEELLKLIHEVGTDICGVMIDPGNGLWAMEDPMVHLQALAEHVVCNSLRDYMVWESPGGATFQWTAIGEGMMDVPTYVNTLAKANPGMPMFVESISNSARPIPFLTDDHWKAYPNLDGQKIIDFLKLCRQGRPLEINVPTAGVKQRQFDQQHQRSEFLNSIDYLRKHTIAGK